MTAPTEPNRTTLTLFTPDKGFSWFVELPQNAGARFFYGSKKKAITQAEAEVLLLQKMEFDSAFYQALRLAAQGEFVSVSSL